MWNGFIYDFYDLFSLAIPWIYSLCQFFRSHIPYIFLHIFMTCLYMLIHVIIYFMLCLMFHVNFSMHIFQHQVKLSMTFWTQLHGLHSWNIFEWKFYRILIAVLFDMFHMTKLVPLFVFICYKPKVNKMNPLRLTFRYENMTVQSRFTNQTHLSN